jgi:hypothetical protein
LGGRKGVEMRSSYVLVVIKDCYLGDRSHCIGLVC